MEVILQEKIRNLGKIGDVVNVKEGFARNYLLPEGKAVRKTEANFAKFEARRAELEKMEQEALAAAQARLNALANLNITLTAKAGEEGKLFGSITTRDIAEAIAAAGVTVDKHEIHLSHPIRDLGEHEIALHLHSDIKTAVKIQIVAEA